MKKDKNQITADKIKEIRVRKNIAQSVIAKTLNITVTAYNRIENGKTQLTVNNLFRIAEALNIGVEILLELNIGFQAHNNNNVVMTNFNHGSLNLTIDLDNLEKIISKRG